MSTVDWESKYTAGETPWDKGAPSPGLVDFLAEWTEPERGRVLIPGCGMGHDVRAWAAAGFQALGCDLAPTAVERARRLTGEGAALAAFRQGDFLMDTPEEPFDWLFEHTLFCAIPPALRGEYVRAAARCLKPSGRFLAVHYMIPDTEGPPFGTTREEVAERFSPHFEMLRAWVPRSYENRTGLEWMILWRRKG